MNQQSLENNLVNIMQTTDILDWAASLGVDELVLDVEPVTTVADDHLLMMRSTEVLDLAAGLKVNSFVLADITNCGAA